MVVEGVQPVIRASKFKLSPKHNALSPPISAVKLLGSTVIVTEPLLEHPFGPVTVTLYVVVTVGVTFKDCVVEPSFHK